MGVAHSAVATVKHACREVTTEHCVDNPKIKIVPVEVKHCHTVTKVTCSDNENLIPKTTCEPVETTHVSNYALPAVALLRQISFTYLCFPYKIHAEKLCLQIITSAVDWYLSSKSFSILIEIIRFND